MPRGLTEQEREVIRGRLLDAAAEHLERLEPRKTGVEDLTRAAGISKGAFYLFHRSKGAVPGGAGALRDGVPRADAGARRAHGPPPGGSVPGGDPLRRRHLALAGALFVLVGFVAVARYASINEFLFPSMLYSGFLLLPLLPYFGVGEGQWVYLHPRAARTGPAASHLRSGVPGRAGLRRGGIGGVGRGRVAHGAGGVPAAPRGRAPTRPAKACL